MKEATGELNMTLVTIIAIAAVLTFVVAFLPNILGSIGEKWDDSTSPDANDQAQTQGSSHGGGTTTTTPQPGMILYY